ncbi:MAG: hypothetical protein ACRC2V_21875, partial [Xenococcaceae cyanobacterium]
QDKTQQFFDTEGLVVPLTDEQASIITGGNDYRLETIVCLKAGADGLGKDDTYLNGNGGEIWRGDMEAGNVRRINKDVSSRDFFRLWDDDGATGDDSLGADGIVPSSSDTELLNLSGSGSWYQLNFRKL